jgi:hypothetical protein
MDRLIGTVFVVVRKYDYQRAANKDNKIAVATFGMKSKGLKLNGRMREGNREFNPIIRRRFKAYFPF